MHASSTRIEDTTLNAEESINLLGELLRTRAGDEREERLLRQGRGWIHIPGKGHEGLAAIALSLIPGDLLFLYYRDRALMRAAGMSALDMAREYLATASSSSYGRAMPMHGTSRRLGIFPPVTPTGSQCLPAVGAAWGLQLQRPKNIVVCTIGDAATRQGEFLEALMQAVQAKLPIVFVVEDNGYGISTPTISQLPFRLGVLDDRLYRRVNGRVVEELARAGREAITAVRAGGGPAVLWVELDRLTSHTNSDDHRTYRKWNEIAAMEERDPVDNFARRLVEQGAISLPALTQLRIETAAEVNAEYDIAEQEPAPPPDESLTNLYGPSTRDGYPLSFDTKGADWTMVGAINLTLRRALEEVPGTLVFGEDVEDPKGGVFGFTKGLSSAFPGRVVNSPLAEATIVGMAVGLAATGFRPVFEVQFVDFLAPAFNQLLNQLATLRWRSNGDWSCPVILYAPYGAYLPAGSTWHSQSNEGLWTHVPGLRVAVPSTPADVSGLLWTALHEHDPTLLLVPKHMMRVRHAPTRTTRLGFGRARTVRSGSDVTLVTWGNCLEIATQAAEERAGRCSVEVIDLTSLVPCDWDAIDASVSKTGRLLVVTEDCRTSSFGQAIIAEMVGSQTRFNRLYSPPVLVAREDGHVPFNPVLEYALLPNVARVHTALTELMR
jgi:2-oxoisovalerate dehydrogenase E1 component